jgi:hypothetical protein
MVLAQGLREEVTCASFLLSVVEETFGRDSAGMQTCIERSEAPSYLPHFEEQKCPFRMLCDPYRMLREGRTATSS